MSRFLLIISAFAMIVSVTVCASYAHASIDSGIEISASSHDHSSENNSFDNDGCDMSCGACCFHHAMGTLQGNETLSSLAKHKLLLPDAQMLVSDFIYGLKRPPKS